MTLLFMFLNTLVIGATPSTLYPVTHSFYFRYIPGSTKRIDKGVRQIHSGQRFAIFLSMQTTSAHVQIAVFF